MERNVQRIDGIVTHLHQLSGEELDGYRANAVLRMHQAIADIEHLEGEIASRRDIGEIALAPQLEVTPTAQANFEQRFNTIR